jgi:peptidoglycan-N-acetylglucosamine deacetylase
LSWGGKVEKPELFALAEHAHSQGHWIGNHTWTHEIPLGELGNVDRSVTEISDTQKVMESLAHERLFFRPFGGGGNLDDRLLSEKSCGYLEREGYTIVLWNSVPRDWVDTSGWVETALKQISEQAWSVIVLHDLPTGAMDHLEDFIVRAKKNGAKFVQDFPESVLPLKAGHPDDILSSFVRAG